MPRLAHTAINVGDLERMRSFYEKYFDARANDKYHNPRTGLMTYFLTFDGECRIELMSRPNTLPYAGERMGYVHIAFSLGSREAVDELTARLKGDGYTVASGPRTTGDGYYESCVLDPEGNYVELIA